MGAVNVDRWLPFFEPFFPSSAAARAWVVSLESINPSDPQHQARIMMHQTQRLVSLSDDLPKIRERNEGLRLLFLLICAEHIAKLADKFDADGRSRAYVRNFFNWFLSPEDQRTLCAGIVPHDIKPTSVQDAADALYSVRCDIVHEGKYWGFHFHGGDTPMLNLEPDVIVSLTLTEFRDLTVRGCLRAIDGYPQKPQPEVPANGPSA